jgi:hypothetical protein
MDKKSEKIYLKSSEIINIFLLNFLRRQDKIFVFMEDSQFLA